MLGEKFNEIMADIRNGYTYLDYEAKYGDYNLTIILNRDSSMFDEGDILIYGLSDTHVFSMVIELAKFVNETCEQIEERINSAIYYTTTEIQ